MRTVRICAAASVVLSAAIVGACLVSPVRSGPCPERSGPCLVSPVRSGPVAPPPLVLPSVRITPAPGDCPEGAESLWGPDGPLCLRPPPADPYGATWEDLRPFGSFDEIQRERIRGFRYASAQPGDVSGH